MPRMPWWGPELYKPENLQRDSRLGQFFAGVRWCDVLRRPYRQLVLMCVGRIAALVMLAGVSVVLLLVVVLVMRPSDPRLVPLAIAALFSLITCAALPPTVRLVYFVFVDRRDIAKVLETQIDYGRQHNIWPI